MTWNNLPVNYTDAVWNGSKRYLMVENDDGTVSFQDVTLYTAKDNSFFGAQDANGMNNALNNIMTANLDELPVVDQDTMLLLYGDSELKKSAVSLITSPSAIQMGDGKTLDIAYTDLQTAINEAQEEAAEGLSNKADLFDGVVPVEQLPPMDYEPTGTASEAVNEHDVSEAAHADIRERLVVVKQTADDALAESERAAETATAALEAITDLTSTIDITPTQNGSLTYTGTAQSPVWNNYDTAAMTIGGTQSGTNAGSYTATVTPNSGYHWWDDTTTAKSVTWTIENAVIAVIPAQNGSLIYTGGTLTPAWSNYNTSRLSLGGATSGTNAGSYAATFTPKANYEWYDGTTGAKNVSWSIGKAAGSSVISPASLSLTRSATSETITVTRSGDGAVTATSGNTAIATVSVSGTVVTVTAKASGNTVVTVKVAAGANHNAPTNKTCSVNVNLYSVYGVSINLSNSNPETSVTYTDDAVGMSGGSAAWDTMPIFKDIKPCLLKNGVVRYYLNPNNFAQKADGSAADTISGNDGDVMIEFPKTGFKINTSGNTLTVQVTDNPNAGSAGFRYYAHTRAVEGDRDKLYIGAYLGYVLSDKLRSLSSKTPTSIEVQGFGRTFANANGLGYDMLSFYPLTLVQCLYLIRFKNLDSQTALGVGFAKVVSTNYVLPMTGSTNAKGMNYGTSSTNDSIKCLGIEDLWGNVTIRMEGFYSDNSFNLLTAFQAFDDDATGYTNRGQLTTERLPGYMNKPQGTTERGFIAKEVAGSASTYFADYTFIMRDEGGSFGYQGAGSPGLGAFGININMSLSTISDFICARLMYL